MALSRSRYDDLVIPYARRSSILEEAVFDRRRSSADIIRRISLPSQGVPKRWLASLSSEVQEKPIAEEVHLETIIGDDDAFEEPGPKERAAEEGEEEDMDLMQDDFEDLPAPEHPNILARISGAVKNSLRNFLKRAHRVLKVIFLIVCGLLYGAYFAYAMYVERLKSEHSIRLLWVTCAVVFFIVIHEVKKWKGKVIEAFLTSRVIQPWKCFNERHRNWPRKIIGGIIICLIIIGIILVLVFLVALSTPNNLTSLLGIFILLLLGFVFSSDPARIRWRPVLTGLLMQFILALIIIKTRPGYAVFKFIGDRVSEFLGHTQAGTSFVFDLKDFPLANFAFKVLPIILFFSTFISVLYYLGAMQMAIEKVAWLMQITMGTTAGESLNAAGNIFVGMTEAPLMIRPFIGRMTNSELHAVMTGGFATVAGSVLGAYIKFGVPANHLISASVMSAPAALAMAKLFHPETKKSKTTAEDLAKMEKSPYTNLVEAAAGGALASIQLVANIAATLIAFLAALQFINETLTWFGNRAGMTQDLTFQLICSYVLWPLAFVMGVAVDDCGRVGELIGVKTFLNEYIAYTELAALIKNREKFVALTQNITNPVIVHRNADIFLPAFNMTFEKGFLMSARSEAIATYSLCGFSNVGAIGIMLGGLSALAPHRTKDIASIVVRAMIAGNVACFLTACIAGLFFEK